MFPCNVTIAPLTQKNVLDDELWPPPVGGVGDDDGDGDEGKLAAGGNTKQDL